MNRGIGLHRAWLVERLRQSDDRIDAGSRRIARQREIIEDIDNLHDDSTLARRLLASYEELQALHIAQRVALFKLLSGFGPDK